MKFNGNGAAIVAFAADQRILYVAHHNKIFVFRCPMKEWASLANKPGDLRSGLPWKKMQLAPKVKITGLKLMHNNQRLITICDDGSMIVHDVSDRSSFTDEYINSVVGFLPVNAASYAMDTVEGWLFIGSEDGHVHLYDMMTPEPTERYQLKIPHPVSSCNTLLSNIALMFYLIE